jgi:tetratricopeptide (TPR) repeat protein
VDLRPPPCPPRLAPGRPVRSKLVRVRVAVGALVIALGLLAVYGPALSGGFILDDDRLLANSRLVRAADGLYRFWFSTQAADYWPVTNSSFWLEWRLWGSEPTGYHVTNVVLHFLSALLFWNVLARMRVPGAFLAALVFAVHPVNVQSVAWISQRKNTLALVFYLASIRAFLASESGSRGWYAASLAAFVLAMLSKGSVAVLPAVLLGLVAWSRPVERRDLVRVLPFGLVAVSLTAVNVWFQSHGASVVVRDASPIERVADAGSVVWFYLGKAIWPADLAFVYPGWILEERGTGAWLAVVAAVVVTGLLWRARSETGRAVRAAWMYFVIALVPVLGFVDVGFMRYALVADLYQYVAILGVAGLAGAAWSAWAERGPARRAAHLAAAVAVAALIALARRQAATYAGPETLYRAALAKNPWCSIAHNNLGLALSAAGKRDEAVSHYRTALNIEPRAPDTWNNLGVVFMEKNDAPRALAAFERAVAAGPRFAEARANLGTALMRIGQTARGIAAFERAVELEPQSGEIRHGLGMALDRAGRPKEALTQLERAAELEPTDVMIQCTLAEVYAQLGRGKDALRTAERALELARARKRADVVAELERWLPGLRAEMGLAPR